MNENELKFYEYWKANCKGKINVPVKIITESWFLLYNKPYTGATCCGGLRANAALLNKRFKQFEEVERIKNNPTILPLENDVKPINVCRGWHMRNEYIDDAGNVFCKGVYVKNINK